MDDLNARISFKTVTGEVVSSDKHSTTSISSSGGGGYVNNGTGYVAAPNVSSLSTLHNEIWIKDKEGREHDIKISGQDIPLRTGHNISVVTAYDDGGAGITALLINHTAEQTFELESPQSLSKRLKLRRNDGGIFLFGIVIFVGLLFLTAWISRHGDPSWLISGGVAVAYLLFTGTSIKKQWDDVENSIKELYSKIISDAKENV